MHELAGSEFYYPRPCMNLSYTLPQHEVIEDCDYRLVTG